LETAFYELEELIINSDVVFTLTDSREARCLYALFSSCSRGKALLRLKHFISHFQMVANSAVRRKKYSVD
jgi:hypothetical protein